MANWHLATGRTKATTGQTKRCVCFFGLLSQCRGVLAASSRNAFYLPYYIATLAPSLTTSWVLLTGCKEGTATPLTNDADHQYHVCDGNTCGHSIEQYRRIHMRASVSSVACDDSIPVRKKGVWWGEWLIDFTLIC